MSDYYFKMQSNSQPTTVLLVINFFKNCLHWKKSIVSGHESVKKKLLVSKDLNVFIICSYMYYFHDINYEKLELVR